MLIRNFLALSVLAVSACSWSQTDSTAFEFGIEGDSLQLSFDYSVLSGYSAVSFELIGLISDEQSLIYAEVFSVDNLYESSYYSEGNITLDFGHRFSGYGYLLVIRLLDSLGQQVVIDKNLDT